MATIRAAAHVHPYYPEAIKASAFIKVFLGYAQAALGIKEERIALLTSVCSDDLNSVEIPDTDMVGPFILGGLDGYPFAGRTGVGAFSHHLPERGAALLFFGPHVGITDKGEIGMVIRPGQSRPSSCCGAGMAALQKLVAGTITYKPPSAYSVDDYQQETLEQLLLSHKQEIIGTEPADDAGRFVRMSEVVYRESKTTLERLLTGVHFDGPAFAFGGILINEDHGRESSIALRNVLRLEARQLQDVTEQFSIHSRPQFDALESK